MKLAEQAERNLAAVLEFGQTRNGYLMLPAKGAPALEGVLYALRQLAEDERQRLEEFAKGDGKPDPEPF
jgi:hypothetical protein